MITLEESTRAYQLAEDHWAYIENLLIAHDISIKDIDIAKFHYKEAFKHGYKHAIMEKENEFTMQS